MSKFIFLDTNNWIYLSNGFNILSNKHDELHLKIFEFIGKRVEEGSLTFLVNDIILEEWRRNNIQAEKQIKEIENKYKSYLECLKSIKEFTQSEQKELIEIKATLEKKFHEKIKRHLKHIKEVEEFLINKTVKIKISDKIKIEAVDLALYKKAPFNRDKKNSMADALILLSFIEYIYENEKQLLPPFDEFEGEYHFPESFFVSSNKGDFSSPEDKEIIHQDLEPILKRTNTEYYLTLAKLVKSLEDKFLTEEEESLIEHADERIYCDYCNYKYFPTINFSEYFDIIDPNKELIDKDQLLLEFNEASFNKDFTEDISSITSKIRTAECSQCSAEYIECTCGELTYIDQYNTKLECVGDCGNKFIVHAEIDKKGMVYGLEYEIVKDFTCEKCGDEFESVNEYGLCEECVEFERISNEN